MYKSALESVHLWSGLSVQEHLCDILCEINTSPETYVKKPGAPPDYDGKKP